MLEFNEFVLHEFDVDLQFHLVVFDFGVFLHAGLHFSFQLAVSFFEASSVKPFRVAIVSDIRKLHDSFFKNSVFYFEIFQLVRIHFHGLDFVL